MIEEIKKTIRGLTNHNHIEITTRGNSAIKSALSVVNGKVLIPEEGGWLAYKDIPKKLGLEIEEVKCNDAKIDLIDLKQKLQSGNSRRSKEDAAKKHAAFLYQNPGGYFAEQPMEEIYDICKQNNCLVILDVSGALGTELCNGNYADILVGSFGKWKLMEAGVGGFISCKNEELWKKLKDNIEFLKDEEKLKIINENLEKLNERINFLTEKRKQITEDLKNFDIIHRNNLGFVVVVKFSTQEEKETIINYCNNNNLERTECPRYIRLNKKAISIEVKRL